MATLEGVRTAVEAEMKEDPSMSEVEAIVRTTWGNAELMAEALGDFAFRADHPVPWVAKKAHQAMSQVEFELFDRQLNRELGLDPDFVG